MYFFVSKKRIPLITYSREEVSSRLSVVVIWQAYRSPIVLSNQDLSSPPVGARRCPEALEGSPRPLRLHHSYAYASDDHSLLRLQYLLTAQHFLHVQWHTEALVLRQGLV